MATILPKEINYQQPASLPEGTQCTSIVASPVNGQSFTPAGSLIQFDLVQRGYLIPESMYLRYRLTTTLPATAGANNALRGTPAYSCFSRLETIVGSQTVESIANYNMISNMLVNSRMNYAQKIGLANSLGYSSSASSVTYAFDFTTNSCNALSFQTSTAANAIGANVSLSCPLGSLLSNCSNLVPLGFMPGVRIQLTTEALANAYRLDGTNPITGYTISQLELCYDVVSFSPMVDQAISQRGGGQLTIKSQSYLSSGVTLGSGSVGQLEFLFNTRVASLKSLFTHLSATSSASGIFDSVDVTNNNGDYQFFVAGSPYPPRALSTLLNKSAISMELSMALGGGVYDLLSSNFSINPTEFGYTINAPPVITAGTPTATAQMGKFYPSVNCERLVTSDALLTGISSQGSPISFRVQIGTATTQASVINLICLFDALLQIDMNTRSLVVMQ